MAERNETLVEGDILFKDLKSKRKTEKLTAAALRSINKHKDANTRKLREMHKRAMYFSIKYILADLVRGTNALAAKDAVSFFNGLVAADPSEDEIRRRVSEFLKQFKADPDKYKADFPLLNFSSQEFIPQKKAPAAPRPAVEAVEDSDTEIEEEEKKLLKDAVPPFDQTIKDVYKTHKDRRKQHEKTKVTRLNYIPLKFKKETAIKLTKKQIKELGGELNLKLKLIHDHGRSKWFFNYNSHQNPTTSKIVKDVNDQLEKAIFDAGEVYATHLAQDELIQGITYALRILFKAHIKGESLADGSKAFTKIDAIISKMHHRAEENKERKLTFEHEEVQVII